MNWTGYHILSNTNARSCIQFHRLCLDSWWKYKRQFKLQYPIHEKLLLKIIPARMKEIRRDILPNTNTENQKVASAMKILKCKMLKWKPKGERPQRQKLAQYLHIWPFQSNLNGHNFWTTSSFGPTFFLDPKDFSSKIFGWSLTRTVNLYKICTCISFKVSMYTYITQRTDVFCIKFLVFKSTGRFKKKSWILLHHNNRHNL